MDSHRPSVSGRLVRAVLAAGILAGGWLLADAVLTTHPASAAAEIDLLPVGEAPVSDLVDTVVAAAPVVAPVLAIVSPVTDPVVSTVDAALAPVATPILTPVRDVAQPIVDTVVTPVLDGAVAVLTPVVSPVVDALVPVVQTAVSSVAGVASMTASTGLLGGGSSPVVSMALLGALAVGAASIVSAVPLAPTGRTPVAPDGTAFTATSFLSDIFSWIPTVHGALAPASGAPPRPHASPVFASDTTPD